MTKMEQKRYFKNKDTYPQFINLGIKIKDLWVSGISYIFAAE
jgi:hypothetical protein